MNDRGLEEAVTRLASARRAFSDAQSLELMNPDGSLDDKAVMEFSFAYGDLEEATNLFCQTARQRGYDFPLCKGRSA